MSIFQLPNWPPFQPGEYPGDLPQELADILVPLNQMAAATLVSVTEHEMLLSLGRNAAFGKKVDGTQVAAGINTINVCLLDSIIPSLCALFDRDGDGIRLRTIMNRLADPKHEPMFKAYHTQAKTPAAPHTHKSRVGTYGELAKPSDCPL